MKTILALLLVSSNVMAAETFSSNDLLSATEQALTVFKSENSDHAPHLTGFKTWISGLDAKVKIYVDHGGMTMDFNYLCQKHVDAIHCHQ